MIFNKEFISENWKLIAKYIFSRSARHQLRNKVKSEHDNIKLIMTLLVKDEEDIIEKNIRFHIAMGADGFIVTDNGSNDKTPEILEKLKKEGFVLEIIKEPNQDYKQNLWVDRMIKLARNKYKADWVINADADEFYYSKDLNLKKSIVKNTNCNILIVDSVMFYPDNRDDFLSCPYFVSNPFKAFEAENLDLDKEKYKDFIESQNCTKVILKTKDYKWISMGNHNASMKNTKLSNCSDIILYHYNIRNYNGLLMKVQRYIEPIKKMGDSGVHMRKMINQFNEDKLKSEFDFKYGDETKKLLEKNGVVTKDFSVYNFLKYKKII